MISKRIGSFATIALALPLTAFAAAVDRSIQQQRFKADQLRRDTLALSHICQVRRRVMHRRAA